MLETATHLVETPNGIHRVRTAGDGYPLVVIPGGPGFGATYLVWSHSCLAAIDRPFVFVDQRGAGGSPVGTGPLTVPGYADDMVALLDAVEIERCDVLCHSAGTAQTLHFAAEHPERVCRIVVSEPMVTSVEMTIGVIGPGTMFDRRRTAADRQVLAEAKASSEWMYDKSAVDRWFRAMYRGFYVDPELVDQFPNDLVGAGFVQIGLTEAEFYTTAFEYTPPKRGSVKAPVLLIFANESPYEGHEQDYIDALPNAEVAHVDGGHLPSAEDPERFRQLVTDFLTAI